MRIVNKLDTNHHFSDLAQGDIFMDKDEVVLMKIDPVEATTGCIYNCVDLENGNLYYCEKGDTIIFVSKPVLTLE